jgi:hypothetical protein
VTWKLTFTSCDRLDMSPSKVIRYHEAIQDCPAKILWKHRTARIEYALYRMRAIFVNYQGVRGSLPRDK